MNDNIGRHSHGTCEYCGRPVIAKPMFAVEGWVTAEGEPIDCEFDFSRVAHAGCAAAAELAVVEGRPSPPSRREL